MLVLNSRDQQGKLLLPKNAVKSTAQYSLCSKYYMNLFKQPKAAPELKLLNF